MISFLPYRNWLIAIIMTLFVCSVYGQQQEIDSLRQLLLNTDNDTLRAKYYNSIGLRIRRSDLDSGKYYLEKGLIITDSLGLISQGASLHFNIAAVHYLKGDYEFALNSYDIAKEDFKTNNPRLFKAANIFTTQVKVKLGKFDNAISDNLKNAEYFREERDSNLLSVTLNSLGVVYSAKGNISKAIEYFYESAILKEAIGDVKNSAVTYANIGDMHRSNKDYESARFFFNKAEKIVDSLSFNVIKNTLLDYIATLEIETGDTLAAISNYKQIIQESEDLENPDELATAKAKLGNIYLSQRNQEMAEKLFSEALDIVQTLKKDIQLSLIYVGLGKINLEKRKYKEATSFYKKALEKEEMIGNIKMLELIHENLSTLYSDQKNFEQSNYHLSKANELKDSIINQEKVNAIAELQIKYKAKEKESELASKNLIIERNENRQKRMVGIIFGLSLLFLFGVLFMRYKSLKQKYESEMKFNQEKLEKEKLEEVHKLKSTFLTNISHEFRTPLTMISGPAQQLIDDNLKGDKYAYFKIIKSNADRLLQLVNQLLELAKMESGSMPLKVKKELVIDLGKNISNKYSKLAEDAGVQYEVDTSSQEIAGYVDAEILEKILNNLITNAIKYSEEGDKVTVGIQVIKGQLEIKVIDTGIGIDANELGKVFDRFYRSGVPQIQGSGIGLSLTKDLTQLHRGEINVESKKGYGSTFSVEIPIEAEYYDDLDLSIDASSEIHSLFQPNMPLVKNLPKVLIVEDNHEMRDYLKTQLQEYFNIIEAQDGLDGINKLNETIPDLVVTDVMMPIMDGIEMVKRIRSNIETSHIPIIVLTAKSEKADLMEGLSAGGEAYLTKPFDPSELILRINQMVELRSKLQNRFTRNALYVPTNNEIGNPDTHFISLIQKTISDNISNELFGVTDLSSVLAMSRSTLTRKLKSITGMGPNELIRNIRLESARQFLKKGISVSETTYLVGFTNLSYFSKCYKEKYGKSPSEI